LQSLVVCITTWAVVLGGVQTARGREPVPDTPVVEEPAPEPTEVDLEQLYVTGEERFLADDFVAAIEAFARGLAQIDARIGDAVPGDEPDRRLRAYFAVSLAIAHIKAHEAGAEQADLARARELLAETVERDAEVLAAEPRLEALARRNLARVNELLQWQEPPPPVDEVFAPAEAASDDERAPGAARTDGMPEPPARDPRRARGVGLLIAGTALTVGSLALFIDGATLERRARAIAEDPPTDAQQKYIDEEVPRLRQIRYGIAGPALALGAGFIIAGGILLRRANRGPRTALIPAISPGHTGLVLSTRF
jgi:hypothetical protein